MAHGDAQEGKWRGNWRMVWVASTLHTTSEHGVSSITTADAHNSPASSRLNWRPRRFKWTCPFRRKTKSGFCACAITFRLASNTLCFYAVTMITRTRLMLYYTTPPVLFRCYWCCPLKYVKGRETYQKTSRSFSDRHQSISIYSCQQTSITTSGVPRNFVRGGGGFNKFSWGPRTGRTGIWGR